MTGAGRDGNISRRRSHDLHEHKKSQMFSSGRIWGNERLITALMELNTHACLLRGRSGKVTAIKRLDLEVYKLEEVKSNGGKKENNFFNKIKGPVCRMFLEKNLASNDCSDFIWHRMWWATVRGGTKWPPPDEWTHPQKRKRKLSIQITSSCIFYNISCMRAYFKCSSLGLWMCARCATRFQLNSETRLSWGWNSVGPRRVRLVYDVFDLKTLFSA